jgi:hypothetical protein
MTFPATSYRWAAGLVLVLGLCGTAQAGVFRCKTADGATVFQDSECLGGAETVQKPKADTGPAVDLTQPLAQRFKNSTEKARLDAALKVVGLQIALRSSVEHCQKYAAPHAAELQNVFGDWRNQHAIAIQTSERLIDKYTTMAERMEGYTEISELMGRNLLIRSTGDPARNAANCEAAPAKLRSFLANRYTDIYATVEKNR